MFPTQNAMRSSAWRSKQCPGPEGEHLALHTPPSTKRNPQFSPANQPPSVESKPQIQGCHFQVGSKWIYQNIVQGTLTRDFMNTAKRLIMNKWAHSWVSSPCRSPTSTQCPPNQEGVHRSKEVLPVCLPGALSSMGFRCNVNSFLHLFWELSKILSLAFCTNIPLFLDQGSQSALQDSLGTAGVQQGWNSLSALCLGYLFSPEVSLLLTVYESLLEANWGTAPVCHVNTLPLSLTPACFYRGRDTIDACHAEMLWWLKPSNNRRITPLIYLVPSHIEHGI